MTDDRLAQAIDIAARHAIAYFSEREIGDAWGLYPEIGENDWETIQERVIQLAPYPDRATYQAAYDYLTERADKP